MRLGATAGAERAPAGGRLPVPSAERRPDGAHHLHLPLQENLKTKRPAGKFIGAQPAPPLCQAHDKKIIL